MTELKFKPVPHDHEAFLAKAGARKGFTAAYESLEREYAPSLATLKQYASGVECDLQVKLVPHRAA